MSNFTDLRTNIKKRNRIVSSCTACYTRKQKCNRQKPCDHCMHRGRTSECIYLSASRAQTQAQTRAQAQVQALSRARAKARARARVASSESMDRIEAALPEAENAEAAVVGNDSLSTFSNPQRKSASMKSLSEAFGYHVCSESNTLGLLGKLGFNLVEEHDNDQHEALLAEKFHNDVLRELREMPPRPILDFLVKTFLAEVNWMSQLLHHVSFMNLFEQPWVMTQGASLTIDRVDFTILVMRICLLASQYLPSPSYPLDTIRGVSLSEIRDTCRGIAGRLGHISVHADRNGSLLRLQHMCFESLNASCEGNASQALASLFQAIHMAESLDYRNTRVTKFTLSGQQDEKNGPESEIRRRVIYNLYIWDNLLSRRLGRVSCMHNDFCAQVIREIHTVADEKIRGNIPDEFEERLLQAKLVTFWNSVQDQPFYPLPEQRELRSRSSLYEPAVAEERYEKFRNEFLATLPERFALEPNTNKEWDESHPKLPLQRQMLHIHIFDSICHSFKPVLLLETSYIHNLPKYKQELIQSHVQTLATAAVNVLDAVSVLHSLIGASYTRCPDIIFYTFEAAAILVCIIINRPDTLIAPGDGPDARYTGDSNSSNGNMFLESDCCRERDTISLERCFHATQGALERLEMLSEVSDAAETGAHQLAQLLELANFINGIGALSAASSSVETSDQNSSMDCSVSTISSVQDYTLDSTTETSVDVMEAGVSSNLDLSWAPLGFPDTSHFRTF